MKTHYWLEQQKQKPSQIHIKMPKHDRKFLFQWTRAGSLAFLSSITLRNRHESKYFPCSVLLLLSCLCLQFSFRKGSQRVCLRLQWNSLLHPKWCNDIIFIPPALRLPRAHHCFNAIRTEGLVNEIQTIANENVLTHQIRKRERLRRVRLRYGDGEC